MRKIQIAISSDLYIRLTWNLTASCGQQQRLCGWSRMVVKQFQDSGRPPFWKSIYRHISAKNHPIFTKFCTQQQILNWMNDTWSKMKRLHWTDSEFDGTFFLFYIFLIFIWSWMTLGRYSRSSKVTVRISTPYSMLEMQLYLLLFDCLSQFQVQEIGQNLMSSTIMLDFWKGMFFNAVWQEI